MTEFSRLYRLETLSSEPLRVEIEAGTEEREALARRFGLVAIDSLVAEAELRRSGEAVTAVGRIRARVTQSCVASAEPVAAEVAEEFQVDFRPLPADVRPEEEIELGEGELDVTFHEGGAIDLGEAAAQTLLLGLDPYPRSPAAEAALKAAGVKSEEEARVEASPFAALAALKGKLE
ncbi:MAG: YceD family protein [Allosphingosinicella sp.]